MPRPVLDKQAEMNRLEAHVMNGNSYQVELVTEK